MTSPLHTALAAPVEEIVTILWQSFTMDRNSVTVNAILVSREWIARTSFNAQPQ